MGTYISEIFIQLFGEEVGALVKFISLVSLLGGFAASFLEIQHTKPIKEFSSFILLPIVITVAIYVYIKGMAYGSIILFYYFGNMISAVVIKLVYHKRKIGPNKKLLDTHALTIEQQTVRFSLLKSNTAGNSSYDRWLSDLSDQFHAKNKILPPEKTIFSKGWSYFSLKGAEDGRVVFTISAQKIANCGNLNQPSSLNSAAQLFYFSHYGIPDKIDDLPTYSDRNGEDAYYDWKVVDINGIEAITYTTSKGENQGYYRRYFHCALSEELMVTFEFFVNYSDDYASDVHHLISTFKKDLVINANNVEMPKETITHPEREVDNNSPEIPTFDVALPTEDSFRLNLRNNAKEPLEWIVFENSDLFYEWFKKQKKLVRLEYNDLIDSYTIKTIESICHN